MLLVLPTHPNTPPGVAGFGAMPSMLPPFISGAQAFGDFASQVVEEGLAPTLSRPCGTLGPWSWREEGVRGPGAGRRGSRVEVKGKAG